MKAYMSEDKDYEARMKKHLEMKRKMREQKAAAPAIQEKEILSLKTEPVEEFQHPENIDEHIKERRKKKRWMLLAIGVAVMIVIGAGIYFMLR